MNNGIDHELIKITEVMAIINKDIEISRQTINTTQAKLELLTGEKKFYDTITSNDYMMMLKTLNIVLLNLTIAKNQSLDTLDILMKEGEKIMKGTDEKIHAQSQNVKPTNISKEENEHIIGAFNYANNLMKTLEKTSLSGDDNEQKEKN